MLSINRVTKWLPMVALLALAGCQSTAPEELAPPVRLSVLSEADAAKQVIDFSSTELSLAEDFYNSPNAYLTPKAPLSASATKQFVDASNLIKQGELAQATAAFEKLSLQFPTLSGPFLKLGNIALTQSDQALALTRYKQALKINPYNYVASSRLAMIKREQGDFSGAEQYYLLALKAWPGLVSAHVNLGILYDLYLGNKEDALAHYKLAQKLNELASKPVNKRLKMWIVDVSRQLKRAKQGG